MASLLNHIILLSVCAVIASAQEVNVAVYFESYCPDSVKFLTKQLYPVFMGPLGKHMNVTLVPYGKANTTQSESGVTFTCHHGEKECKGNRVISCVLNETGLNFQEKFKFINCTSSTIAADVKLENYPIDACLSGSTLSVEKVVGCEKGTDGERLLEMYGNMTMAAFPQGLENVPTVVFNGNFNKDEHMAAVKDFRKALCSKISGTKPAECTKNGASGLQAAVFPLIAAIYAISRL